MDCQAQLPCSARGGAGGGYPRAYAIAASGRPGPVLIDIPKDVQQKKTRFTPKPPVEIPKIAGEYTEKEIAQAVKLMEKAKRPCFIAAAV